MRLNKLLSYTAAVFFLAVNCLAEVSQGNTTAASSSPKELHLRSSFSESEACSDFKVVQSDARGRVMQKSVAEAAIIPDELFAKESDPKLATVNLVVNENPTNSFLSLLQQLGRINKTQYARAGIVYVVTTKNPFAFVQYYSDNRLKDTLLALSFENTSFALKPVMKAPEKYQISNSPSWIIEYEGKEYVFEGNYTISSLFSNNGEFRGKDLE